ncbi:hypothetical protein MTO96_007406 [Rhipicephalus appendiculatus]
MFNGKLSLIAQYLNDTTALRELRLELFAARRSFDHSERTLLQALSNNKSVRRLSVKGLCISEGEAEMLGDALQSKPDAMPPVLLPVQP